jgi:hypothetical protein
MKKITPLILSVVLILLMSVTIKGTSVSSDPVATKVCCDGGGSGNRV